MSKNQHTAKWTEDDIKILKKYYPKGGSSAVAKHLRNRTEVSIKVKANRLGVKTNIQGFRDSDSDWNNQEIDLLKKWYPLIGYRKSKIRSFIGTPYILDILANRTVSSIQNKARRLSLDYNPQKGVGEGLYRCNLCLKIKDKLGFTNNSYKKKSYQCKLCQRKIYELKQSDTLKRLSKNLALLNREHTSEKVSIKYTKPLIAYMLSKFSYKCVFEDEYCDNFARSGLTIGHINSISRGGEILDKNNIMPICMLHNSLMSDLNLGEIKRAYSSMLKKLVNELA